MDEHEQQNDHLVRATGQLAVVLAAYLHRQGIVSPNALAESLGMMAVVSDDNPKAGQIVAYWASLLQDLATDLQSRPPADTDPH